MSISEKDIEKWRNEIVKLKEEVKDRIAHGLNGESKQSAITTRKVTPPT